MIKAKRKVREGVVTSDKMDKTITVKVERSVRHRLYKRTIRQSVTFKAHDEKNECKTGDKVRIVETRPLSATKRWRLLEVVERAKLVASVAV
jgi:small subunit ribosomal protein S17